MISLIAAMGSNREIGKDNKLLWNISEDMQWFKKHTLNKTVVMGRKTYESIGKPLKGRVNVVISSQEDYKPHPHVIVTNSVEETVQIIGNEMDIMVIGGESIYKQFLPLSDRLYITKIHMNFEADSYFPKVNEEDWIKYMCRFGQESSKVGFGYSFNVYRRNKKIGG